VRFEPISARVTRKPLIDLSFVFKAVDVLYFRPRAVSMDLPIAVGDLLEHEDDASLFHAVPIQSDRKAI
jgi:hypothetical protein